MQDLHYVLDISTTRDELWERLTTPQGLSSWLCLRANVSPVVGGPFEVFFNPDQTRPESDSTLGCRVLAIDRPRMLRIDWRGADELAEVMNAPGVARTEVEFLLFPTLTGSRLEVTHSGWGDGQGWERARAWFHAAWSGALESLHGSYMGK
jgi:uncharacterized protein YndB with AHSA1/START domain